MTEDLNWIAFKNQFFSSVFIADQDFTKTILESNPQEENSGYLKDYKADMSHIVDPSGAKSTNMKKALLLVLTTSKLYMQVMT